MASENHPPRPVRMSGGISPSARAQGIDPNPPPTPSDAGTSARPGISHAPTIAPHPAPDELVQVLMTEAEAREYERSLGGACLSPLLSFNDDDVPTYLIWPSRRC